MKPHQIHGLIAKCSLDFRRPVDGALMLSPTEIRNSLNGRLLRRCPREAVVSKSSR
jgi:hypothetical protein